MSRLISYLFIGVVIFLFVMEGRQADHIQIIIGALLATLAAYTSFFLAVVSLDAILAISVFGTIVFGFGGWIFTFAVLAFFISSSAFSLLNRQYSRTHEQRIPERRQEAGERRSGLQVWANGFWIAVFLTGWFLFDAPFWLVAAFGALATAASDTWATEWGTYRPGKTVDVVSFKLTKPGTDGGVSVKGTIAALAGAAMVALFMAWWASPLHAQTAALIVFLSGILGCLADSYIGALLRHKNMGREMVVYSTGISARTNSVTNWLATGFGGLAAMVLNFLFGV
ncbi:MAG: DUF92 domain-containing protein [Balneolaceae bacterium]